MADVRADIGRLPSRRALAVALTVVPLVAPAFARSAGDVQSDFAEIEKAAWVWRYRTDRADEIAMLAKHHRIGTLFVSVPMAERDDMLSGVTAGIAALRRLEQSGTRVWALAGDAHWLDRPHDIAAPLETLIVLHERFGIFAGLHLDIEPHAHPDWTTHPQRRSALIAALAILLGTIRERIGGWPLELAVHPMLATWKLDDGRTVLAAALDHAGSIAIMAYRDSAAETLAWAQPAIAEAGKSRASWRIGVLTYPNAEPRTSWAGASIDHFTTEMTKLDAGQRLAGQAHACRGLAFEDFDGFCRLFSDGR